MQGCSLQTLSCQEQITVRCHPRWAWAVGCGANSGVRRSFQIISNLFQPFLMLSSHLTVKVFNIFSSKLPFERILLLASIYTYVLMIIKFLFLPDLRAVLDLYVQKAPGLLLLQCLQTHQMQCSRIADIIFFCPPDSPRLILHLDVGCYYCLNSLNWL